MTRILRRIDWFEAIYWSIIAACVLGCFVGCERRAHDPTLTVPRAVMPDGIRPGDTVVFEYESDGGRLRRTDAASGTGPGLSTSSDEAAASFDTSAPAVGINGTTGTGGSGATEFTLRTVGGAARNPLLWVGIVAVLAGLACFYFGLRRAGTYLVLGGGGFVIAAMLPGWAWLIIAGVCGVGVIVYVWSERDARRSTEAARAVVAGVADLKRLDEVAYARVKAAVASHADESDRAVIDSIKRKDRL